MSKKLRIAAFGFRSLPPLDGSAGADKFVYEMLPRLVSKGHNVVAYNRKYLNYPEIPSRFKGVKIYSIKTVEKSGFDTLIHSLKSTYHILRYNTADIIHIQNGGNSIWALVLRIWGKTVFISQDGYDWKRDKWPWYAKVYLYMCTFITSHATNKVICDNEFIRDELAKKVKVKNKFVFIPFGSEVEDFHETNILEKLKIKHQQYILFVGRFIPDKGIHYLIEAFKNINTDLTLVLVGGAPNKNDYEGKLISETSEKIIFPGFIYGNDTNTLIKNAYLYVQPSDVEGLSPVILQVMGMGVPLLCSDIVENKYIVKSDAVKFRKSDVEDLEVNLKWCINNPDDIRNIAIKGKTRILNEYSWDKVVESHIKVFNDLAL